MKTAVHLTTVHNPFDNRIFYKQCVSLARMGYRVVLVVPHERDEAVQGVEIRALPKPRSRFFRLFCTIWQAYGTALREQADLYHFHDPELIPAGLLLRLRGKKVIYDIHEDYVTSMLHVERKYLPGPLRVLFSRIMAWVEGFCSRFFVKVLAEKYYAERFPGGVQVLNYPKLCFTAKPREHGDVRTVSMAPLQKDKPAVARLLYTGNITRERGALLHARLVDCVREIELFMVGRCDAGLAEEMYGRAGAGKERLHIEGINRFVPFTEIMDYYQAGNWTAGLALFPPTAHYRKKELTKFFEYMAFGIPIISSHFPVWQELMQKTGAGVCVDPDDMLAVAAAIEDLAADRQQAEAMGQSGRKAVANTYNWEHEAKKLESLYQRLLG